MARIKRYDSTDLTLLSYGAHILSLLASHTIGFIGAGNMAEALIRGLVRGNHVSAERVHASGPRRERLDELTTQYQINTVTDNKAVARLCGIVVLSVKPQIMDKVLAEISAELKPGTLIISVAAGVDTESIESALGDSVRVVRAMPNTPAIVGAGATGISAGRHAGEDDLAAAKAMFDAVGISVVLDESHLDAVTGLSGSGPRTSFSSSKRWPTPASKWACLVATHNGSPHRR